MQARRGVLFFTAGSDLVGRRNVEKSKRTKYCVADKAYKVRFSPFNPIYAPCFASGESG